MTLVRDGCGQVAGAAMINILRSSKLLNIVVPWSKGSRFSKQVIHYQNHLLKFMDIQ